MGKKTGVFTEGQLVYAKVKGYSPWPAKVSKIMRKIYTKNIQNRKFYLQIIAETSLRVDVNVLFTHN